MPAASVANKNFRGRFNAASKRGLPAGTCAAPIVQRQKPAGNDPVPQSRDGAAPRRMVEANRYSAMVTNRVLPPKWISVILLSWLTNAEYLALLGSSFHCTGASAITFPFIEMRTWVSSAVTA